MPDWGMSGRRDSYAFTAVDPFTLMEQGPLDCIPEECSITYGFYTDNRVQATITMLEDSYREAVGNLIRVSHSVELPDGTTETEVLGTFFIDSAEKEQSAAITKRVCNCYSTMWRLSQDYLASDFVMKKNQACATRLSYLMSSEGATVILGAGVTASKVHTQDARFKIGSNRLECSNTYAGWCGWQIDVDDYGRQVINVYTPPELAAPSHFFEDGQNCTYLPAIKETFTGEVCNRVVAMWSREKAGSDGLGLSGRQVADLPSGNPYSYEQCGRRITHVLKVKEPMAASDLLKAAKDYLASHDAAIRFLEVEHVGIPNLRAGDTVTYTNAKAGDFNLLCEVTQMDIRSLGPLMICRSKLKVVGS